MPLLARLGESGADAFTLMRVAGHLSVVVSQWYVHPSPEAVERAFERLEALNALGTGSALEGQKRQSLATVSATVGASDVDAVLQPV